jgi:hypothetical protein
MTDEGVQHDAETPHIDGRTGVRNRGRVRDLCTWHGSVHAEQQLRRGAVLITAARHEQLRRRHRGSHRVRVRGGGGGGHSASASGRGRRCCCACEVRDDSTASCPAGRCGGVDADKDVFDFEICGGGFVCVVSCHVMEEGGRKGRIVVCTHCGALPRARGGARVYGRAVVRGGEHCAP